MITVIKMSDEECTDTLNKFLKTPWFLPDAKEKALQDLGSLTEAVYRATEWFEELQYWRSIKEKQPRWIVKMAPLFRTVESVEPYTETRAQETGAELPEELNYTNPLKYCFVIIHADSKERAEDIAYHLLGIPF